ncbi:MAG: FAD/NAD(P)-binding oxidoreductase, partial [Clostridia bacterium]|nr:FAD/NAD(P)-binding oxidoreductase [Clostridia bacterium]
MKIKKLQKKLKEQFPSFAVREENGCRIVSGESDNWQDIIKACCLCVSKDRSVHVVNDVTYTGQADAPMRLPAVQNNELDGRSPDVLIIGGGISGATI